MKQAKNVRWRADKSWRLARGYRGSWLFLTSNGDLKLLPNSMILFKPRLIPRPVIVIKPMKCYGSTVIRKSTLCEEGRRRALTFAAVLSDYDAVQFVGSLTNHTLIALIWNLANLLGIGWLANYRTKIGKLVYFYYLCWLHVVPFPSLPTHARLFIYFGAIISIGVCSLNCWQHVVSPRSETMMNKFNDQQSCFYERLFAWSPSTTWTQKHLRTSSLAPRIIGTNLPFV